MLDELSPERVLNAWEKALELGAKRNASVEKIRQEREGELPRDMGIVVLDSGVLIKTWHPSGWIHFSRRADDAQGFAYVREGVIYTLEERPGARIRRRKWYVLEDFRIWLERWDKE